MSEQNIVSEFVLPFIDATHSTFEMMVGQSVVRKDVYIKKNYVMFGDVSGVIGVSGKLCGTSAVTLPAQFAIDCVSAMMGGEEIKGGIGDVMVHDGVGELINMIAGQAKTTLGNTPYKFNITLPTIISGRGHEVYHKQGTICVSTIFETEEGEQFAVELCTQGG
jgi:chemotaxis protein CheX